MRTRSTILLSVGVALVMLLTAGQVMALTYSVSVQTVAGTYSGTQPIVISGAVSPAPGNSTAVFIKVYNPNSVLVIVASASVNVTTGAFRDMEVTGGTSQWVAGQYLVNATWGATGPVISGTTTFQYSVGNVTSTTNSTSSSTNSTTSSTSTSSSSTSSTTTSSTTSTASSSTTTSSTTTSSTTSTTTSSTPTTKSSTIVITTSTSTTPTSTTSSSSTGSSSSVSPYFAVGVATVAALAALSLVIGRRRTEGPTGSPLVGA